MLYIYGASFTYTIYLIFLFNKRLIVHTGFSCALTRLIVFKHRSNKCISDK